MDSKIKVQEMTDNKDLKEKEIAAKKTESVIKNNKPTKKAKIKKTGKTSKKKQQGPYRESGLKSNNKKK